MYRRGIVNICGVREEDAEDRVRWRRMSHPEENSRIEKKRTQIVTAVTDLLCWGCARALHPGLSHCTWKEQGLPGLLWANIRPSCTLPPCPRSDPTIISSQIYSQHMSFSSRTDQIFWVSPVMCSHQSVLGIPPLLPARTPTPEQPSVPLWWQPPGGAGWCRFCHL